jgi:hypothetical protein
VKRIAYFEGQILRLRLRMTKEFGIFDLRFSIGDLWGNAKF